MGHIEPWRAQFAILSRDESTYSAPRHQPSALRPREGRHYAPALFAGVSSESWFEPVFAICVIGQSGFVLLVGSSAPAAGVLCSARAPAAHFHVRNAERKRAHGGVPSGRSAVRERPRPRATEARQHTRFTIARAHALEARSAPRDMVVERERRCVSKDGGGGPGYQNARAAIGPGCAGRVWRPMAGGGE
jgi:hypothetical protein